MSKNNKLSKNICEYWYKRLKINDLIINDKAYNEN